MMRRSGDSLAGRYFTFRLNPVTLRELSGRSFEEPPINANEWVKSKLDHLVYKKAELSALLQFSGFPEPLLINSVRFHNKWRRDYLDRLIREDLRDLTKETKAYFYDWTRLNNPARRFENYVAVELKTLLELWTDAGIANFHMNYLRNRDGKETDFLILRNQEPWMMLEAKFSRATIDYHHRKNRELLGHIPFVQIVRQDNIAEKREDGLYQISASRLLA